MNNNNYADKATRFSLLVEAWGSMRFAYMALLANTPDIYFDTTGCAFTYFVARILAGCHVVAYVHYPTISVVRYVTSYGRIWIPDIGWILICCKLTLTFCFSPTGYWLQLLLSLFFFVFLRRRLINRTCWQWYGIADHPTTMKQVWRTTPWRHVSSWCITSSLHAYTPWRGVCAVSSWWIHRGHEITLHPCGGGL